MKHRVWIFLVLVITCMTAAVLADGFSTDSDAVEEAALSVLKLTVYDQSGEPIATGSGFIMFDNMTLVTNYHVIEDAHTITAESDEGYSYDLRSVLIGSKRQDIAILRMKTPTVMRPLPYSTDPLHRAQKVIAIGSPKGIKNTVSVGIISNTVYSDMYFQHTAATSSGSSGGALFNDKGEVVGITSALRNDGNDIYLAIPIGRAVALYEAWDRTTAVAIADYERANADGQNIPATAMETGWLAESSDYISLWTQNDEKYLEDVGTSFDLRQLGSDEYVAPCYYLQNDSSQRHEVVCYWLIDGEQIEFEDDVLDSGDHMIRSLSRETASEYGVGSHCAEIYVNGQKVREFSWTITAGSDAPGATYDENLTGWLRDATIDVALWTQNADRYIEQVGDEYGLEGLGSGEYVAPRLRVTNHSSGAQTAVIKWVIDGDKWTWPEKTIEAGDTFSTSLDETDTDYFTPGLHEADFYVNDTHVASYRWVLTQNGSGVDDWLQTASVSISLWRQDDDNFYADMGNSYTLSALGSGVYVAPRLYVTNNSSINQSASVYWMIDGEKITFNERTIEPGEQLDWTLIQETARRYEAAGTHTMEAYVNERLMTTYTWTVTQPVATPTPEPDWLQTATIEISLWSRDDEDYIKDIGNSYTLSALGSGVYVVPRLYVTNNSSINQSASVYWMIDGNKISFSDATLEPAERQSWSLHQSTAREYETAGTHTAKVYVNDRLVKTYTWTVNAPRATATPEPDWLETADIEMSLWTRDDEDYIQNVGNSYTPSEIASGEYVTLRLSVANRSSVDQNASVYWMVDGEKISFSDTKVPAGMKSIWTLSETTMRRHENVGTHTAKIYVNDRLMKTYTWTVNAPRATATPEPDWLQTAKIEMSLWSQDDEHYIKDLGNSYTPSTLGSGVYAAPRMYVTNNSSTKHSASVYWMIDGNKISFSDATLEPDERRSWSLAQSTARKYETAGTHTVKVYINDRLMKTYTWTVKASRATPTPEPDWLQTAKIEISLWSQDDESYIKDLGDSYTPSELESEVYVAPRLYVTNNSSINQSASVYWMIDGNKISFSDATIEPAERRSWSLSQSTARKYETAGTHTAKVYINDRLMKTYTWTVKASRATPTPEPDWLQTAKIEISLWSRDDERFIKDMGDSYTLSALGSGVYVAPRLYVTNNSSINQSASIYWMIDGNKISFFDETIEPAGRRSWSLSQSSARKYETAGTHTAKVYINDRLMKTYTWTVKASRATATPEPDWLQTAKIEISLWSQDDEHYIKDIGNSYTLSALGSGVYVAPRLYVTNNSSINQSASVYWMIDGNKISFSDATIEPSERKSWSLSQSTARKYETAGTHTAKVYINDRLMKTYTWTVKSSSSSSRAQVVPVTNGTILIKPSYKEQCRFTVTVDSSTNFYVYLKYQGIPANTRLRRETSGLSTPESDVAFYVRAGQEVSIRVPIGEYRLYYACGKDFYGTKLLFGDDTRCYQMDEMVCFYSDDEYYYGYTLTLHASASNAESIGRADFPTR